MSTFLIETSEEDSTLSVARVIADFLDGGAEKTALAETTGSRFLSTCSGLVAENRYAELLELLLTHARLVFTSATGKDLECCLLVTVNLVAKLPVEQQEAAGVKTASALIAACGEAKRVCLMALVELYNVSFDSSARFSALLTIIKFARENGLQDGLGPVVQGKAPGWVKDWGLTAEQTRSLYSELSALLKCLKTKAASKESFDLRMKCLASYEGASPSELAAARSVAAETAADLIANPDLYKCDLFELAAFKQLESDTEHVATFQLLNIIMSGDIKGLNVFAKDHGSALTGCNISLDDAILKTRVMALLALISQHGPIAVVSFDKVKEALQITDDEVEQWIVMAIGKKLIEAKINQLESTVMITRYTHRTFGAPQWTQLRTQLATWRENLSNVSELASSARLQMA